MPAIFRFTESRNSRGGTVYQPTERRVYTAAGTTSETFVRTYALGATPYFIATLRGTIYRQDVQVEAIGYALWKVTVPYGPRKKEEGEYTIDFDTAGGTVHITNSKETIQRYAAPNQPDAPDMGGAIGVRGDQVDGTEIVIPALKYTVEFQHPAGIITQPQIKVLGRYTGRTNSTKFLSYDPGEVLFLGCRGREGTNVPTSIVYEFAMSENVQNQAIGPILNTAKKGWEFGWISYQDRVDGNVPHKRPRWYYVERVYDEVDLATLVGFGGE